MKEFRREEVESSGSSAGVRRGPAREGTREFIGSFQVTGNWHQANRKPITKGISS